MMQRNVKPRSVKEPRPVFIGGIAMLQDAFIKVLQEWFGEVWKAVAYDMVRYLNSPECGKRPEKFTVKKLACYFHQEGKCKNTADTCYFTHAIVGSVFTALPPGATEEEKKEHAEKAAQWLYRQVKLAVLHMRFKHAIDTRLMTRIANTLTLGRIMSTKSTDEILLCYEEKRQEKLALIRDAGIVNDTEIEPLLELSVYDVKKALSERTTTVAANAAGGGPAVTVPKGKSGTPWADKVKGITVSAPPVVAKTLSERLTALEEKVATATKTLEDIKHILETNTAAGGGPLPSGATERSDALEEGKSGRTSPALSAVYAEFMEEGKLWANVVEESEA